MSALDPLDAIDVHDPRMTAVRTARLLADLARTLNYATLPGDPRLEYPSDVYMVLESLHAALSRLPQACEQLAAYLQRQRDAGVLYAERGFPHADRPGAAVEIASAELRRAAGSATLAAIAFGRAHAAISGLTRIEHPCPLAPPQRWSSALGDVLPERGRGIEP